jgi:mRNA-degrading endonuclease RelE of RelBE toxin-antitoxin system
MFEIELTVEAIEDLRLFSKRRDQRGIIDALKEQLKHQPSRETRNRKKLRPNQLGEWELRVDKFRVFYDIVAEGAKLRITAPSELVALLVNPRKLFPPKLPSGLPPRSMFPAAVPSPLISTPMSASCDRFRAVLLTSRGARTPQAASRHLNSRLSTRRLMRTLTFCPTDKAPTPVPASLSPHLC